MSMICRVKMGNGRDAILFGDGKYTYVDKGEKFTDTGWHGDSRWKIKDDKLYFKHANSVSWIEWDERVQVVLEALSNHLLAKALFGDDYE